MIIHGHRGARAEAPENTLAGFAHARSIGLTAVEFDVRMTADGRLVVIHDATVDRTTDGSGAVAELSWAELADLDAAASFPDWPQRCAVPTLDQVLAVLPEFGGACEIEIKADSAGRTARVVAGLLDALDEHGLAESVVLTSFHATALAEVGRRRPGLARGYIGDWADERMLRRALDLGVGRACVQHATSTVGICRQARDAGLEVIGWPCNDERDWQVCRAWAVDGVTTDRPGWLLGLADGPGSAG